ncbi:MAG TPA: protein kinase [Polyangiaceae bacterium]|nr:protein kinase [Polyangiaceae bacterium]
MTRPCPQCGNGCDESHKFCPLCGFPISQIAGTASVEDPFINRTLPGGYVILDLVGIGGMGRVYRAEQRMLGRTVAVKVIHPHLVGDESASARFIAEARAASRLNHPHSVGVIDFGKTDDGQLYLVMEFLRGRDLARVAYEEGPLPIRRIIEVMRQALAALAEAHHLGIIHRDLKPENIILEPLRAGGDFVKVVDFGLAKMVESPRPAITTPGIICGTPDYMAPEQGRGAVIDARADLYSMGIILFQLLTGRLPFEADTPTQVVLMHLSIPPPDPRQVSPERNIPEALADAVARSLNKEPDDRWASATEMAEALTAIQAELENRGRRASHAPPSDCPSCGQTVPAGQKFCGECGARISIRPSIRPPSGDRAGQPASGPSAAPQLPLPLTHRQEDLAFLEHHRTELRSSLTATRIVGESGVGKTRLLREFLAIAKASGDFVVETGPDPWWAEVGYYAARRSIGQLAGLGPAGGDEKDWAGASAEARRGIIEVFGRADALSSALSPSERRYTAAEALRWALTRAARRAGKSRVVLAIDDLNRVDGASRNAFADALAEPPLVPVLIVATHVPSFDPGWSNGSARPIAGLPTSKAAELARAYGVAERISLLPGAPDPHHTTVLPLYLDQLVRFTFEGGSSPPARLADLVALRIERLAPATRRVLQALAVLGDNVDPHQVETLFAVTGTDVEAPEEIRAAVVGSIAALENTQMIERSGELLRHTHPLVREIAGASIPAAVRRELQIAAARDAEENNLPIEVRALHTLYAQDSFEALLLSEQVAERALARGDASGAVLWLHRALELARRELFRGELDDPMRAVLIFSRKLGEALTVAGDLTDADGVLREALDVAGPSGPDRAKVLGALATVAHERARSGDAHNYLSEALEQASKSGAVELVASLEDMRRAWAS